MAWRGLADSNRTLQVGGYTCFPRDTVRMERLRAAPKT
jgi:hypothetical protein